MPLDIEGLVHYLAHNPAIKGIGPAKARLLAERYCHSFESALETCAEEMAASVLSRE